MDFADLEQAYIAVCAAIPETARELLSKMQDPLAASSIIADPAGRVPMTSA